MKCHQLSSHASMFCSFRLMTDAMDRWERLGRLGVGQKPLVEEAPRCRHGFFPRMFWGDQMTVSL